MAKATTDNLKEMGFDGTMFGGKSGATWTTYLTDVLAIAAAEVEDAIGSTAYSGAATDSVEEHRIIQAERYIAASILWQRAKGFLAASAAQARDVEVVAYRSQLQKDADRAREEADRYIQRLLGDEGGLGASHGGLSTGKLVNGDFATESDKL